ncbi:maleylpyruvate isomerase family mycothiol-dependent enzyme [Iamia sp.]|uniref:maleylpyruvate isomerase family mycothiol-dependent enzyme n=1 Tax=Iamia sp. TaxID=2722710 RepID=UPI002BED87C0|nr:maleylpyruvate isomerase family mycothiol-dependent enzyme [Iamia sp.]HXH57347.1 maleylpyruvate isomerase family mycothiol-dependent enzyme [Iamia sp.]
MRHRERLDQTAVIDALAAELASLDELLSDLTDDEWSTPTALRGWDVMANVAHIVGTEAMLAGVDPPPDLDDVTSRPHVRNDIGGFNETWVAALADEAPAAVLDRLRTLTTERLAALRAMDTEAWDAEGFTPAGLDTHGRFMRIRVFDCWMHEQDIRDAVGRPGHTTGPAVELALDELETAMGFVVGKRAGAPSGVTVTFALHGGGHDRGATDGVDRQIHVVVAERASVVAALDGPATVMIRTDVHTFSRLAGGRTTPDAVGDAVAIDGDEDLGHRILANLSYTI